MIHWPEEPTVMEERLWMKIEAEFAVFKKDLGALFDALNRSLPGVLVQATFDEPLPISPALRVKDRTQMGRTVLAPASGARLRWLECLSQIDDE